MISCKKSTEWVIKREHGKLTVKQNLQLLSHLSICSFCRLLVDQSAFLNQAFSKNNTSAFTLLTEKEKEEMLNHVQNKILI